MEPTTTPPPGDQGGPTGPYGPYPSSTPPPPRPGQGTDSFFDAIRRTGVVRTDERWIGGVAGGIALRFGIDALLVRGILAASILIGGFGLVVYGLGWALLPEQRDGRIHLQETIRGHFDIALLGAVALFLMGLNRGSGIFWWAGSNASFGWINALLWIAGIVAIVAMAASAAGQHRDARSGARGGPSATGAPAPAAWAASGSPTSSTSPWGAPSPAPSGTFAPPPAPGMTPPGAYGPYAASTGSGWQRPPVPPVPPVPSSSSVPPVPPAPRRPHARGAGPAATGIVMALSLLSLAWLMLSERAGVFDGPLVLTAAGITIVLAGLGIMVTGLRGRRSGGLGTIAVLTILIALPFSWSQADHGSWNRSWVTMGDETFRPVDRDTAEGGYTVVAGDVTIDLTDVPYGTADTLTVPVSVGAGNAVIIVPEDIAVKAVTRTLVGQLDWKVDGNQSTTSSTGVRQDRTWENDAARSGHLAQLVLEVQVNAGQVTIEEGN